jgi:hypothetical protein
MAKVIEPSFASAELARRLSGNFIASDSDAGVARSMNGLHDSTAATAGQEWTIG